MNAATPPIEPSFTHARLWAKPRAILAVAFAGLFTLEHLGSRSAPNALQAGFITSVMLAVMWASALWAVLGLRARTIFSAAGVVDIGVLRTVSLPWERVTSCTVVEKTLRAARGRATQGVRLRFTSKRPDPMNSVSTLRPRDRVIELFVADAVPLAPGIIALLRTIPRVSQAPWDLLEPSLRRQASTPQAR